MMRQELGSVNFPLKRPSPVTANKHYKLLHVGLDVQTISR